MLDELNTSCPIRAMRLARLATVSRAATSIASKSGGAGRSLEVAALRGMCAASFDSLGVNLSSPWGSSPPSSGGASGASLSTTRISRRTICSNSDLVSPSSWSFIRSTNRANCASLCAEIFLRAMGSSFLISENELLDGSNAKHALSLPVCRYYRDTPKVAFVFGLQHIVDHTDT